MIAVIEVGGKQYTVEAGQTIVVDHQHTEVGKTLEFSPLLTAEPDGSNTTVGTPFVEGAKVVCSVEENKKGDKIRVFKHKPKKRYMRTQGFRPMQTVLVVKSIA
ncbi:50S ribosomal protein L21 [Candidatus Gracilibacteria bacterium]|nr:MAG: 50S ribosomal protein L21 [Candidatus Gracilibacteria bacterium]